MDPALVQLEMAWKLLRLEFLKSFDESLISITKLWVVPLVVLVHKDLKKSNFKFCFHVLRTDIPADS